MSAILSLFKKPKTDQAAGPTANTELKVEIASPTVKEKPAAALKTKDRTAKDQVHGIILRPLVTEKVTGLSAHNAYVFAVHPKANKIIVKEAVARKYGVHPIKVRIIRQGGKVVRWGRTRGKRAALKKAIVTLPPEEKLSLYEGV